MEKRAGTAAETGEESGVRAIKPLRALIEVVHLA